jgi:cytoskeletal protein RodZ
MGELGQLLRQAREAKEITLEEAENATRIRFKFLAALEEADYDVLPTPGHVHGFLRNYALYLGLDWEEVRAMFAKETSSHRLFEPGIFHPKDISLESPRPLIKADFVLGMVIVLVVAIVGGWAFWQYGWPLVRPTPTPTPTATARPAVVVPTQTATKTAVPTATDTPALSTGTAELATATSEPPTPTPTATPTRPVAVATATPSPTSTALPTVVLGEGVTLQIRVIERAWLQVTVDGQALPGELLEAGAERTWEAKQRLYFICGNAGGVEVTVNGQELGLLGQRAQVVEKTWTPEGEVTPVPTAMGTVLPTVEGTPSPAVEGTATPTG